MTRLENFARGVWSGFWQAAAFFFGALALGFATLGIWCERLADKAGAGR